MYMTYDEYLTALEELDGLMDADPGSLEEKKLLRLSIKIETYEKIHYPIQERRST
jgi:antitoxin component HigA of HigAB toxin-antitoxin module